MNTLLPGRKPLSPWSWIATVFLALGVSSGLAAPPRPPRALLQDAARQRLQLRVHAARASWRSTSAPVELDVACGPNNGWPGVRIEPPRPWDLSAYDRIAFDVENLGSSDATVVLAAHNPGSDGRKRCSAVSRVVARGRVETVVVALGTWHGPDQPFDRSNVAALGVSLEKPSAPVRIRVKNVRAVALDKRRFKELAASPAFRRLTRPLGVGINLSGLEAPREGAWGWRVEDRYFRAIACAGFDFVRLPVRWSAYAAPHPPYAIHETFFRRIDRAVEQALKNDLSIMVNVHHFDELLEDADRQTARFLAIWRQISERYAAEPDKVVFELLNEPRGPMTATEWNDLLAQGVRVIRARNRTRSIVVGPVDWNSPRGLKTLRLPDDPHLIATVHYYLPFRFTHQGATWVGQDTRSWIGTRWTGTEEEREAIRRDLDAVLRWSLETGRPMLVGEFGVIAKADEASRVRWTAFMAEEMARRKMAYAWWDFSGSFAVYDRRKNEWLEPLVDAIRRPFGAGGRIRGSE